MALSTLAALRKKLPVTWVGVDIAGATTTSLAKGGSSN